MASNTPNLNLVKADGSDLVNLTTHINNNWDTIDGKLDASVTGDLDLDALTGSAGLTWTPTNWTSSGGITSSGIELVKGDTVAYWFRSAVGSVSGNIQVTLPWTTTMTGTARHIGYAIAWDTSTTLGYLGAVIATSGTTAQFGNLQGTGVWNATAPFTWAAGDVITFYGMIERT